LVTGSVDGSLDHPRVTVRLIEPSGRQVESKLIQPTGGDVLALRSELAQEVARFLRERLGREVRLRELRSGGGARGWVQVRRAEELREDAHALYVAGDTAAAGRTFDVADSLLASIEREDPGWVEPLVNRGWIAADRIGLADARTEAALSKWAPLGIRHAERALARLPGYPAALELRGFLHLLQWQYSPKAEPRLVQAAERDLRAATVPENPSRARAMSTLAYLLWRKGSFAEANLVARGAYQADVFLADAPMVLYRLYVTSLLLRRRDEASDWCSQGHQRFPDQWLFALCRLTLLSTPAPASPDPAQAWRLVAEMQRATPPSEWAGLAPRWEMLVATVLARAGQRDSARKILRAAHQAGAGDPEMDFYEAETHVTLGEYQLALDLLDRYTRYAPSQRAFIQGWPTFDPLQPYARFKALQPPLQ
jgi:tetratricopeptide (TPR) repeat protein